MRKEMKGVFVIFTLSREEVAALEKSGKSYLLRHKPYNEGKRKACAQTCLSLNSATDLGLVHIGMLEKLIISAGFPIEVVG